LVLLLLSNQNRKKEVVVWNAVFSFCMELHSWVFLEENIKKKFFVPLFVRTKNATGKNSCFLFFFCMELHKREGGCLKEASASFLFVLEKSVVGARGGFNRGWADVFRFWGFDPLA